MENLLTGILANMEKEKELYLELIQLSTGKTDLIIEKRVRDLEKLVAVEENIIANVGRLESERQELLQDLAKIRNIDSDSITQTNLIDWAYGDMKVKFQNLQSEFEGILHRQKHLNEINSKLLKTNLEYIDFAILLMTGEGASGKL
jgi:phosphosulfolactate synthase (CoM biosynthesis protein A)